MAAPTANPSVPPSQTHLSANYNCIDLIKFLCSILVFCVHVPLFSGDVSPLANYLNFGIQHYLARIAVPFFFVSSGFFLFRKMSLFNLDYERIKAYCYKLLCLYAIWSTLLVLGGTYHLWYLSATVVAVIAVSLCFHFQFKPHFIFLVAAILYIIGLLGDSYYGIVEPLTNYAIIDLLFRIYRHLFLTTRNGLFMGFVFILMGAALAHEERRLSPKKSLAGFFCSMLLLFLEVYILKTYQIPSAYNMYIFLIPAVFFLFSFASEFRLKDRPLYKKLRHIGLWVYYLHLFLDYCAASALDAADAYFGFSMIRYRFWVSLLVTLLFASFAEALSRKDKFKWLNLLIS